MIVDLFGNSQMQTFNGADCLTQGLKQLKKDSLRCHDQITNTNIPLVMTSENERAFQRAKNCWICEKALGSDRVRDHDHMTGKFRGAAHNSCNINLNDEHWKLPVFFHNGRGYDFHLLSESLVDVFGKINPISNDLQKMTQIRAGRCCFQDSLLHFPGTSLDKWVKTNPPFKQSTKYYPGPAGKLMRQKGVYPYEWATEERMCETELPPIEAFTSSLSGPISKKDYVRAQCVWGALECKTFLDYHNGYLRSDVALLADCFEAYRDVCYRERGLDPARFPTSPSLAQAAAFKMTKQIIDGFYEGQEDMLEFAESARRGLVQASHRHVQTCDPDDDNYFKRCLYIDANNLYGKAMMMMLAIGSYTWKPVDGLQGLSFEQLREKLLAKDCEKELPGHPGISTGYFVEVDMHCPAELHDKFNDLPFFPEMKIPTPSPWVQDRFPDKKNVTEKLVADLHPKTKYKVDLRLLQLALRLGYVVTKVHRILAFAQKAWLRPNADGKRRDKKLASSPLVKTWTTYRNYRVYAKHKKRVKIDRPVLVGACILDLSKLVMYQALYDEIKPKNPTAMLAYMDTDSFILAFNDEPVLGDLMDKNTLGKFKDECAGGEIGEVIALRAKTYSVQLKTPFMDKGKEVHRIGKAKGVPKKALEVSGAAVGHDTYVATLATGGESESVTYKHLRSKKHQIRCETVVKKNLSAYDDKRFIVDGVVTRAHGHWQNETQPPTG
eukprot:m.345087 g.345087  ORF g.345087 m.345087 type:complete len:722 (-) comp19858_c0_seq12:1220-3385(-)